MGYAFSIPCFAVVLFSLYMAKESPNFWFLALLFAVGVGVGLKLIFNPPILVSVNNGMLELYPGSLGSNAKQLEIPLEEIQGFEVKSVNIGDGFSWLLLLHLSRPPKIPAQAQRWIDAAVPKEAQAEANEATLLWGLSWPEGGVKGANEKMKMLTSGVSSTQSSDEAEP